MAVESNFKYVMEEIFKKIEEYELTLEITVEKTIYVRLYSDGYEESKQCEDITEVIENLKNWLEL